MTLEESYYSLTVLMERNLKAQALYIITTLICIVAILVVGVFVLLDKIQMDFFSQLSSAGVLLGIELYALEKTKELQERFKLVKEELERVQAQLQKK